MDNRPIGIFDSGLGGLSCVFSFMKELPNESFIYFGDTARTPYGDKDERTIQAFTNQIADFLTSQNVKMLVIACNTVSALCTEQLRQRHPDIPVVGIIEPTVRYIDENLDCVKKLGIIATNATIKSSAYTTLIQQCMPEKKVSAKACPMFVPMIENGFHEGEVVEALIRHYMEDFIKEEGIEQLVLGCTHYPFFRSSIEKMYPQLQIINPSEIIVKEIVREMDMRDMRAYRENVSNPVFYASDLSETFVEMIQLITKSETVFPKFKKFKGDYF